MARERAVWNHPSEATRREFERLAMRSYTTVLQLAYRLTHSVPDAQDVTQDAFAKAWRHFASFDRTRRFEPWVCQIAANLCIDFRHRNSGRPLSLDAPVILSGERTTLYRDLGDERMDPERLVLEEVMEEPIAEALRALPNAFRTVLLLAAMDEYSYEEISEITHTPVGTVRSRIHRARERMRSALEPYARRRLTNTV